MEYLSVDDHSAFTPRDGAVAMKIEGRDAWVCANATDGYFLWVFAFAEFCFISDRWFRVVSRTHNESIVEEMCAPKFSVEPPIVMIRDDPHKRTLLHKPRNQERCLCGKIWPCIDAYKP